MSTNVVNFKNNMNDIENQRNCIIQDTARPFNINIKTKAYDDKCFLDIHTSQSKGPGDYHLSNHFQCECNIPDAVEVATNNTMITFKNGFDIPSCEIDRDSTMRIGKTRKNPRCPTQLFHRPNGGVPFKGRGMGDIKVESKLLPGQDTVTTRPCNVLSGVSTLDRVMVPLVPHLKENVQNPEHLVEEVAEDGWVRGGSPSRLVIRDVDYLQRCGYDYMDKEANGDFWENKHNFL